MDERTEETGAERVDELLQKKTELLWFCLISHTQCIQHSRDSSVGISSGWGDGVRFPVWANIFLFSTEPRPAPGAHLASYKMGMGSYIPGIKAAEAWSWPLNCK
jgi:hypothetical protein